MDKDDYCIWRYSFVNGDTTFKDNGIENKTGHPLYPCTKCDDEKMLACPHYKPIKELRRGDK